MMPTRFISDNVRPSSQPFILIIFIIRVVVLSMCSSFNSVKKKKDWKNNVLLHMAGVDYIYIYSHIPIYKKR